MFGIFSSKEINDDAVRVVGFLDQMIVDSDLLSKNDFVKKYIDKNYEDSTQEDFAFIEKSIPDFKFNYSNRNGEISIFANGRAKYTGFLIGAYPNKPYSEWHCSASDTISNKATAGSHKLAKAISKKFGVFQVENSRF